MTSRIGQNEVRRYYYRLINEEFRNLQLDGNLKNKSVFDLIDYCELLYETSSVSRHSNQGTIKSDDDDGKSLTFYIRGYLIFNYFINSFIMLHFKGFDQFIKSNEYDFIIYLNVFAFYNTDDFILNNEYSFPLNELRILILEYLKDKNLLKFNVDELYAWLYEYIEYLKQKDDLHEPQPDYEEDEQSSQSPQERKSIGGHDTQHEEMYTESFTKSHNIDKSLENLSIDEREFNHRFPSIDTPMPESLHHVKPAPSYDDSDSHDKSSRNHKSITNDSHNNGSNGTKSTIDIPPIPKSLPPGLPLIPYPLKDIDINETPYPLVDPTANKVNPKLPRSSTSPVLQKSVKHSNVNTETRDNGVIISQPYSNGHMHPPEIRHTSDYPHKISGPRAMSVPTVPQYTAPPIPSPQPYQHSIPSYQQPQQPPQPSYVYQQPYQQLQPAYQHQYPQSSFQSPGQLPYQQPYQLQYAPQPHNQMHRKSTKMNELSICGLKNFGSSCYINSTIQVIFGIHEFKSLFSNSQYNKFIRNPAYVRAKQSNDKTSKENILLSEAISGLLKSFKLHGGASIAPTKFIRLSSILKPDFNIPYEQQDSQEFLLFLLDRLHEELSFKENDISIIMFENYMKNWKINIPENEVEGYYKWYNSLINYEGTSPIHDLFQGHLQNKLICDKCGFESINYSPFTILSLPIPNQRSNLVDLSDCLRYYTQDEILSGDNAWNCPKCHKESETNDEDRLNPLDSHPVFTKKTGLFKFSRRSKSPFKDRSKSPSKDKIKSSSSSSLPISVSTKRLNFIKLPQVLFIHLSRFSTFNLTDKLDTNILYPIYLKFNNYSNEITYKLIGIINHYGNLKSGHYTALVNKSSEDYWCYFDDESVRLNVKHGSNYKLQSRDVYVLCYQRI